MLLANVVLMAQLAANSNTRQVDRPCADESALCRISPFFCPGTYPQGLEPCWPDGTRQTRNVGRGSSTQSTQSAPSRATAPAPAHSRAAGNGNATVRKFSGD